MLTEDQIRKYPFFEGLNGAELARLANILTKRSFARGAYVFYPGSPGANAYLVESGLVKRAVLAGKAALVRPKPGVQDLLHLHVGA